MNYCAGNCHFRLNTLKIKILHIFFILDTNDASSFSEKVSCTLAGPEARSSGQRSSASLLKLNPSQSVMELQSVMWLLWIVCTG